MLIYCVEDDNSIRELVLCALKTGGFEGVGFDSGTSLWNELEKRVPDLILLDIMLPNESGINIINKLKSSKHSEVPVIFLTAKGTESDRVLGLDLGADDYIVKPFGVMELLSRIKAVIRRASKKQNVISEFGIILDLEAREVTADGKSIALTYKEFELLHLLMKNSGKVINRDKLLLEVWGYDFIGESRTLDVHIRTLRQKLSEAKHTSKITTIRNVGYKLEKNNI